MGVVVRVDWDQLDYFRAKRVLGNMTPVFAATGVEILKEIGRNFEAEGLWSRWAPLKPNTLAGRRQGSSSKALQASGRLRASFRMEAGRSQVRIGSPLKLAQWHHEGRGEPVGGSGWEIKPKHGKALAFPVARGGQSLKGMGKAKGISVAMIRGNQIQTVHKAGPGASIAGIRFKSYGYQKRSAKFLANVNMALVQRVHHPGYAARPLLPPPARALEIAQAVVSRFLRDAGRG